MHLSSSGVIGKFVLGRNRNEIFCNLDYPAFYAGSHRVFHEWPGAVSTVQEPVAPQCQIIRFVHNHNSICGPLFHHLLRDTSTSFLQIQFQVCFSSNIFKRFEITLFKHQQLARIFSKKNECFKTRWSEYIGLKKFRSDE